jgi:hypothetical protein
MSDDRAVSTALGYILTLAITALLITGLLTAGGDVVADQREVTIRNELQVIGQQMAAYVATGDRLAQTTNGDVALRRTLPSTVVGSSYLVEFNGTTETITLRSNDPEITVVVRFDIETALADTTVNGGAVRIVVSGGTMEVHDG